MRYKLREVMITLNTIEKGTKFNTTAVKEKDSNGSDIFTHFESIRKHASLWGFNPEDILDVECEIMDNDLSIESILADQSYDNNRIDYFCCASAEDGSFNVSLIFPNIKLFFMCFPYGCDIERYWQHDIPDEYGNIKYRKGDRRNYMMRIKVKELK